MARPAGLLRALLVDLLKGPMMDSRIENATHRRNTAPTWGAIGDRVAKITASKPLIGAHGVKSSSHVVALGGRPKIARPDKAGGVAQPARRMPGS